MSQTNHPPTEPPSDPARTAAEACQYCGETTFANHCINEYWNCGSKVSAHDDFERSTRCRKTEAAALRRDVEDAKRHAEKSLDSLAERDREVFALTASLAVVTKERDEAVWERGQWECSALLYHSELRDLAEGKKVETMLGYPVEQKIKKLTADLAAALASAEAAETGVETIVSTIADRLAWNWTRMMSERDAADCILGMFARVGLITEEDHPLGGKIWTTKSGKKFGRIAAATEGERPV